jgi:hypothetical protein
LLVDFTFMFQHFKVFQFPKCCFYPSHNAENKTDISVSNKKNNINWNALHEDPENEDSVSNNIITFA